MDDGIDQNCVNDAPVITTISDQSMNEDETAKVVAYTLTDLDDSLTCTSATDISYTSSDGTLLPLGNITR